MFLNVFIFNSFCVVIPLGGLWSCLHFYFHHPLPSLIIWSPPSPKCCFFIIIYFSACFSFHQWQTWSCTGVCEKLLNEWMFLLLFSWCFGLQSEGFKERNVHLILHKCVFASGRSVEVISCLMFSICASLKKKKKQKDVKFPAQVKAQSPVWCMFLFSVNKPPLLSSPPSLCASHKHVVLRGVAQRWAVNEGLSEVSSGWSQQLQHRMKRNLFKRRGTCRSF